MSNFVNESPIVNDPLVNSDVVQLYNHDYDPNDNNKKKKFECYCGREFASLRGLNIHRRSCV